MKDNETILKLSMQHFAEDGGDGGTTMPDTDGEDANTTSTEPDGGTNTPNEHEERANQLETQLKTVQKQLKDAQNAVATANREKKNLERAKMTDADALEEQRREMEENSRNYKRMMSSIEAEKIFVGAGIAKDDYSAVLEMIATEDSDKTTATAQEFVDILSRKTQASIKSEREKILKETPPPPAGAGKDSVDPFVEAFKKG